MAIEAWLEQTCNRSVKEATRTAIVCQSAHPLTFPKIYPSTLQEPLRLEPQRSKWKALRQEQSIKVQVQSSAKRSGDENCFDDLRWLVGQLKIKLWEIGKIPSQFKMKLEEHEKQSIVPPYHFKRKINASVSRYEIKAISLISNAAQERVPQSMSN